MDSTTALTGMLPAVVLISALLAAVASVLLLRLYRRATLRGMARVTGAVQPPLKPRERREAATAGSAPLIIKAQRDATSSTISATAAGGYRRAAYALWAAAGVYAAAGLAYALVLATAGLIIAQGGFILDRFLWLLSCYAWPSVLAVNLVAATSRRQSLAIAGVYFALLLVTALYVLGRTPGLRVGELAFYWFYVNAPGTALLLAFLHRRVRAVGPLVLAFMIAGVTGAFLLTGIAGESDGLLRGIVTVGATLGLGATTLFVLMHVAGFAAFAVLGWWLLRLVGRRYRAKRLSDQSLTIDALWLLFAVVQSIPLAFEGWGWIFTGLVAFGCYKLVTRVGFARLSRHAAHDAEAPVLLLLRVFALGRRSERFFDVLSKMWRRSGSISLIAGPDLMTAIVEPHAFLDFVGGRHAQQFVRDEADLERRLADQDTRPDPDGRFRVNEYFCHADTWQSTMRRLAQGSDAVLMDLRGFSRTNQGCLYELEQLMDLVDLERVAFVVDETTDRPFLEETLQQLWQGVDRASPNRRTAAPAVQLFHAGAPSGRSIKALLHMLPGTRVAA